MVSESGVKGKLFCVVVDSKLPFEDGWEEEEDDDQSQASRISEAPKTPVSLGTDSKVARVGWYEKFWLGRWMSRSFWPQVHHFFDQSFPDESTERAFQREVSYKIPLELMKAIS
jgi:hypothetical protein